jgi:hypothetical protein
MRLDNALAKARKTYAGEALASLEREIGIFCSIFCLILV